jgi:hypothetical protein
VKLKAPTDLEVFRDHKPVWPNTCVFCNSAPAESGFVCNHHASYWAFISIGKFFRSKTTEAIPGCAACVRRIKRQRLRREAIQWSLAIAGAALGVYFVHSQGIPKGITQKLYVAAFVVGPLLGYECWDAFFNPVEFEFDVSGKYKSFSFRDPVAALRFVRENSDAIHLVNREKSRINR